MKRMLLPCLLLGLTAVSAGAAEPAPKPDAAAKPESPPQVEPESASQAKPQSASKAKPAPEAKADLPEPVILQRKLEFEVSEEPYAVRVSAASLVEPQVRDLRHVAVVRLSVPAVPESVQAFAFTEGSSSARPRPYDLRRTRVHVVSPHRVASSVGGRSYRASLVKEMAKQRRLPEDVVSDLDRAFLRVDVESQTLTHEPSVLGGPAGHARLTISVCATTSERARELVDGLFALLDHGICYPSQRQWMLKKQSAEQELAEPRAKLAEQQKQLAQLQEEYQKFDEFKDLDKTALSGLKTQQRLIAVDIAGAKAQIEACIRMLADLARQTANTSRLQQIEGLKIAAEIELVGLTARKNALDEIVEKGATRAGLGSKVSQAESRSGFSKKQISEAERTIAIYEAVRKAYEPFAVRGKITIHPIKWEVIEASKEE